MNKNRIISIVLVSLIIVGILSPISVNAAHYQYQFRPFNYSDSPLFVVNDKINKSDLFLPGRFSLKDYGQVSSVKRQNPFGTCWAMATCSSAESYAIKKYGLNDIDLSELHLAYYETHQVADPLNLISNDTSMIFNGNNEMFDMGGNPEIAINILASGKGFVDEEDLPYSYTSLINEGQYVPQQSLGYESTDYIMDSARYVLMRQDNINTVKKCLMDYGAIVISYGHYSEYYNSKTYSYYCNEKKNDNHCVTLVGWDDNYSRNNFTGVKPNKDGAWICLNSWGETFGNKGYYYISYQDATIVDFAVQFGIEKNDHNYNIYQYDGSGYNGYFVDEINHNNSVTYGNIYTTQYNEILTKVGFFSYNNNYSYKISVYTDVKNDNPQSGKRVCELSGDCLYAGYNTVDLNKDISLERNTRYSVIVKITANNVNEKAVIAVDRTYANYNYVVYVDTYNFKNEVDKGQSFFKGYNESKWTDFADYNCCGRVKAYCITDQFSLNNDIAVICQGKSVDLKYRTDRQDIFVEDINSSDDSIVTINDNILTGNNCGTATVTFTLNDGNKFDYQVNVVKEYVINGNELLQYNGDGKNVNVPAGVEVIGANVFKNLNIGMLKLPVTLKSINRKAFVNCTIEDLDLPYNLKVTDKYSYQPTCTESGRSEQYHCRLDKRINKKSIIIPPTGHDLNINGIIIPTTKNEGSPIYSCCDKCHKYFDVNNFETTDSNIKLYDFEDILKDYKENNSISYIDGQYITSLDTDKLSDIKIEFQDLNGNQITDLSLITSSTKCIFTFNEEKYVCTLVNRGDCNLDGKISSLDCSVIKNIINGNSKLMEPLMLMTCDVNNDGLINALDYADLRWQILKGDNR